MQRWTMVAMVMVSAGLALGCGDSDDGGSTIRSVCDTTCDAVLDCTPDAPVSKEECSNDCVQRSGNLVCDEVNEPNLAACLAGIEALTCEQWAAGDQAPLVCDRVCLVRIQSETGLTAVPLTLIE